MVKRCLRTPGQCMALARRKQQVVLAAIETRVLLPDIAAIVGEYHAKSLLEEFERQVYLATKPFLRKHARVSLMADQILDSKDVDICKWKTFFVDNFHCELITSHVAYYLCSTTEPARCLLAECWVSGSCQCQQPCTDSWLASYQLRLASLRRQRLKRYL